MSLATDEATGVVNADIAKLFPLPLSTFEAFTLADTTVDYPGMCDMAMEFSGRLDRATFDAAFAVALSRAPLFRSLIEYDSKGRPQWVLSDLQPHVDWAEWDVPFDDQYDVFVDLTRELSFRVYVRTSDEKSRVMLHFHHACCDGLGAYAFSDDFIGAYHNALNPDSPVELRPLQPELLLNRDNTDAGIRGFAKLKDAYIGVREGIRFFLQHPLTLTPRSTPKDQVPPTASPPGKKVRKQRGFIHQLFPEELAIKLREVAKKNDATLNDVLMRDLYLTLADWDKNSGRQHLRFLMPQSLREEGEEALPTTNRIGFAFVTRRADYRHRPQELLKSISAETSAIVEGQLSRYFIDSLRTLQSMRLLKRVLGSSMCFATAVHTNVGSPQRRFFSKLPTSGNGLVVGNLVFNGMTGMPHLRPKTAAAFTITGYGKSFYVNLKCDSYMFTREDTEELLAAYFAQLTATARGETDR